MSSRNVKDILLAPRLDPRQAIALLGPYGFKEPARADANLQALADEPTDRRLLADILEDLLSCVAQSADPDQALNYFERFARAAVNRTHLFSYLKDSPYTLEILARAFGGSQYMSEILIRDPVYLYWLADPQTLYRQRKKSEIARDILRALKRITTEEKQFDFLRAVKRREMLHIGMRDLLRLCSVQDTLSALSLLAEVLISAALRISVAALEREYGIHARRFRGFTILGMGKLGGGELNFSSDVDLIYLRGPEVETAETESIASTEYFRRLAQKVTQALSDITNEGYIYRVDLRLRPEGRLGDIAYTLDGFRRYYYSRGETWERLALLKTWPVAGDMRLGKEFLALVAPFIYDRELDHAALNEVRRMKQKIARKMAVSKEWGRNVKLGFGGIREIELIAQSLQVAFGNRFHEIRERNTLRALAALCAHSLISEEERTALSEAYVFLRDVENKLQMVNDAQTHAIPAANGELNAFARMMGYSGEGQLSASDGFLSDYRRHTARVNGIYEGIFD
ncbi:MAG: glutamate-ammonia-ligase adenylyltransferase, partial [Blastocatellia bacterium]|nr:glutamate-ammonia-ligase adenylyltransferase [Blastocatellia bacterium]